MGSLVWMAALCHSRFPDVGGHTVGVRDSVFLLGKHAHKSDGTSGLQLDLK